jgi:hypothetical protein
VAHEGIIFSPLQKYVRRGILLDTEVHMKWLVLFLALLFSSCQGQWMPSTIHIEVWQRKAMYAKYDYVLFGGNQYQSTMGANENHRPNISPQWWLETP